MNVSTISMEPSAAQAKLQAYRQQLRRRADEEYQAAAAAYEALAKGTPLVNLADAFTQAGTFEDGRPRLAIARADRKQVVVSYRQDSFFFNALKGHRWNNYSGSLVIGVPFQPNVPERWRIRDGFSLVPIVPADVRPDGALSNFFILWEVEQWANRPIMAVPDYDPFLLKHITGDLYAVVAEWDLTELERAIMTGRRQG